MIEIGEERKIKRTAVRQHLELLADPGIAERNFDGISAVRDEHDEVIPGALCYRIGVGGAEA